jgi:hypothetical protein
MRALARFLASAVAALALLVWRPGVGMAQPLATGPLYVNPSGNDITGAGTAARPFASIARAVALAPAGGTVLVEPGRYAESVAITRAVILQSDPEQPNATARTVIDASNRAIGVWVRGAATAGSAVRGLTVENAGGSGIVVQDTTRVTIADNMVTGNGRNPPAAAAAYAVMPEFKAIQLLGTADSVVQDNQVAQNLRGGIAVVDSPGFPGHGNTVSGNQVIDNRGDCGIVVAAYVPGRGVDHNLIADNRVTGNVAGIVIAADPADTSATANMVQGNVVASNLRPGIIVHSNQAGQVVRGNVIRNNVIHNNGAYPEVHLYQTAGIAIIGAQVPVIDTQLTGNQITGEFSPVWIDNPASPPVPSGSLLPALAALLLIAGSAAFAGRKRTAGAHRRDAENAKHGREFGSRSEPSTEDSPPPAPKPGP